MWATHWELKKVLTLAIQMVNYLETHLVVQKGHSLVAQKADLTVYHLVD